MIKLKEIIEEKPKYMFHVSPVTFRKSIVKYGLDPKKLPEFGFESSANGTEVYFFADLGEAHWYRDYMSRQEPRGPMDIWIVDVTGIKLYKDYSLTQDPAAENSAWFSKQPISKEKIKLYNDG